MQPYPPINYNPNFIPPYHVPQYPGYPPNMMNYNYLNPNPGMSTANTSSYLTPNQNNGNGLNLSVDSLNANKIDNRGNL